VTLCKSRSNTLRFIAELLLHRLGQLCNLFGTQIRRHVLWIGVKQARLKFPVVIVCKEIFDLSGECGGFNQFHSTSIIRQWRVKLVALAAKSDPAGSIGEDHRARLSLPSCGIRTGNGRADGPGRLVWLDRPRSSRPTNSARIPAPRERNRQARFAQSDPDRAVGRPGHAGR